MMKVNEVSKLTGVSARTLHYYDKIGLLHPAQMTESGYRLYSDADLEKLQHILLFRELQFSLKEIKIILDSPDFDRNRALEQQITLLRMRKTHLENLIDLACGIKATGVRNLDFSAFDTRKIDEYATQAKTTWGQTEAYREYEEKSKNRTTEEVQKINQGFQEILAGFGGLRRQNPSDETVQLQVRKLQDYITEHFYTCTKEILKGLGAIYAGGGSFTETIDGLGGVGTAEFMAKAIDVFYEG